MESNTTKAIAAWYGSDTYGTHITVACDASGKLFWRAYEFNGYARAWSKWKVWNTSGYANFTNPEEIPTCLEWGFNKLRGGVASGLRYRLPR